MFVEDREPDSILCHHGTGEDHVTSTCDVPVSETKVYRKQMFELCVHCSVENVPPKNNYQGIRGIS